MRQTGSVLEYLLIGEKASRCSPSFGLLIPSYHFLLLFFVNTLPPSFSCTQTRHLQRQLVNHVAEACRKQHRVLLYSRSGGFILLRDWFQSCKRQTRPAPHRWEPMNLPLGNIQSTLWATHFLTGQGQDAPRFRIDICALIMTCQISRKTYQSPDLPPN